ncbi:hypothetical protein O6H91_18G037800 [Diphasiastrum complanatum]|uniref:Uncharacterized protein n=1 Tax=Diphasiastrum complanatum TaxID=34168 RepID=A0ACC2B016_DIPCM|nr:hypothetical protein O6H91_18G037800 [Diphasiastrum complanatum]
MDSCSPISAEMALCGPRISLSEGFVCVESDSGLPAAAEVCRSTYSSDFEFFMSSIIAPERGRSPSQSMCSADRLFSNGQILPLDQVQVSQASSQEEKLKELTIADHLSSEIGPAALSRRWTDMFKLKRPPTRTDCPAAASSKQKQVSLARSFWFLRRSTSTNNNKSVDPCMPDVDPWLGRSASDSRIKRFLPPSAGALSRKGCIKPTLKASTAKHYEAFKSESHSLSQKNSCSNVKPNLRSIPDMATVPKCKSKGIGTSSPGRTSSGKKRVSINSHSRASDAVEARATDKKLEESAHKRRASKRLNADQGIYISQKRREFVRSRSQKQHEHRRSSIGEGSYQIAPVLHMQMCMGQSFITSKVSKARLVDLCTFSFLKKERVSKSNVGPVS